MTDPSSSQSPSPSPDSLVLSVPPLGDSAQASPESPREPIAPAPSVPMRPAGRYQHVFWFALLLATVAVLAGTSIAVGAYQSAADPGTVVQAYFAALVQGDAASALGYGAVPSGRHDLLTADVLAAQNAVASISNVTIRDVQRNGDSGQVNVTYLLAFASGKIAVADSIPVVRHGHDWRLSHSAVPQSVSAGAGSTLASFAGSVIPSGDYAMFPGAVPVTYATPNLEPGSSSQVVRFGGNPILQVSAQVSPAGRKAIAPALRAALAACLAGKGNPQTMCPTPTPDSSVPGSLRGTASGATSTPPSFDVANADGKITITEVAKVKASYQNLDQNNLASATTVDSVSVSAHCFATVPATIIWDTP